MKLTKKRTKDPRVLSDGTCYQCGKERPEGAVFHEDPFCKTECCRAYYAREPRAPKRRSREKVAA